MAKSHIKFTFAALILSILASSLIGFQVTNSQVEKVVTKVVTSCDISVDDIVEGQSITVTIQMSPATPTGEGYRVWIWVTPPNPKDFGAGEPWLKNLLTDSNGKATVTFNVRAYSGKWLVDVSFGSMDFVNHTIFYIAGHWQKEFTVSPITTPAPSAIATPTASPIPIIDSNPAPLTTPSMMAPPKNYTIPPLSSLNLKVSLYSGFGPKWGCGGLIHIQGGSGNDANFRVLDPQGKTVLDLGRISNDKEFFISATQTGNYTIILDNEFSMFSSKEVEVFSYSYPDNLFRFAGFSFNFLVISIVVVLFAASIALAVWLFRRKQK